MAWLSDWAKRKSLTIDHLKIDADLSWFPVAVIIDGDSDFFGELSSDTDKLKVAFTKSDETTQLYFECEHFDATAQKAVYHVSKSDWTISSASDTEFYIYFDSSKADNTTYGNTTGNSPATNVWDSNFEGVWHLDETSSPLQDATSNNLDLSQEGTAGLSYNVDSLVSKGVQYGSGTSQADHRANANFGTYYTAEILVKFNNIYDWNSILYNNNWSGFNMYTLSDGTLRAGTGTSTRIETSSGYLTASTWYHLAIVLSSGGHRLYKNGTQTHSNSNTPTPSWGTFKISNYDSSGLDGIVDEVRVSSTARSAAWVKATYNSLFDTLLTWGSLETYSAGTTITVSKGFLISTPFLTSLSNTISLERQFLSSTGYSLSKILSVFKGNLVSTGKKLNLSSKKGISKSELISKTTSLSLKDIVISEKVELSSIGRTLEKKLEKEIGKMEIISIGFSLQKLIAALVKEWKRFYIDVKPEVPKFNSSRIVPKGEKIKGQKPVFET